MPGRSRTHANKASGQNTDSSQSPHRQACRERATEPIITKPRTPHIKGLGKLRYVVQQTFALLHEFRRPGVRWERRSTFTTASPAS